MYRPRINNSEVQSGKFLLCESSSSWMTSSPQRNHWPTSSCHGHQGLTASELPCLGANSGGNHWGLLTPWGGDVAEMWQQTQPLLLKSLLTCLLPQPTLGHHPGPTRGPCMLLTLSLFSAFIPGCWTWGGHSVCRSTGLFAALSRLPVHRLKWPPDRAGSGCVLGKLLNASCEMRT